MSHDQNPKNEKQWNATAKALGVDKNSIHDLNDAEYASASKITPAQYLTLRVLWRKSEVLDVDEWLDNNASQEASKFLNGEDQPLESKFSSSWSQYLDDISKDSNHRTQSNNKDIGLLSLVRYFQKSVQSHEGETSRTPKIPRSTRNPLFSYAESPSPSLPKKFGRLNLFDTPQPSAKVRYQYSQSPQTPAPANSQIPAEDEQLVNSALLMFLISVTAYHPKLRDSSPQVPTWSLVRKSFQFGHDNSKEKCWTAITDGYLRIGEAKVMGIVEVKPYVRELNAAKIQKQEAAQMAAWIYQYPDNEMLFNDPTKSNMRWRLLVSQDSVEIYLIFAEYDTEYREYLRGNNERPTSFMTMKQYGPWMTTKAGHMESLGEHILAFTLKQLEPTLSSSMPPTFGTAFPAPGGASSSQSPVPMDKGKGRADESRDQALVASPSREAEPESPEKRGHKRPLRPRDKKQKEKDPFRE